MVKRNYDVPLYVHFQSQECTLSAFPKRIKNVPNGINLSSGCFAAQSFSQHIAGLCHSIVLFWSAFDDTWFEAIRPFRVYFQVTQLGTRPDISQSAKRVRKADALHGNFLSLGCLVHHGANQVVDQSEHRQLLENAVHRLTMQNVHFHGLFQVT